MTRAFRPYKNYTERRTHSGEANIPWLTSLPEHWEVIRSKRLFATRKERARANDEQLSATQAYGVIPQKDFESKVGRKVVRINQHLEKRAHVEPDDFVISMRSFQGGLERAWARGCIRSSYVVLNPSPLVHIDYFAHLFKSQDYISALQATSNFIRDGQDLNFSNFCLVDLPLPPQEEQGLIGRFLDWKSAQINKFIRNKRRFIELLKEQKQNVINQAVTRGLDPKVKFKPSGVEWIGDIPEHWEIAPLKHLASINARVLPESTDENYTFKYCDISSVGTGRLTGEPETLRFGQAPSRARRILKKGDTILSTVRTYLKAVYYVADEVEDWIASTGFAALTPKKEIHPPFLGLLIQSGNFINRVIRESIGVAYPAIAETKLGTLHLAYPVSFEEQQEILEHIADSSKAIDQAITRTEREIELMREYRTRLISDVVTGQVDVRGIEVPEVAEEELLALEEDTAESDDVIDDEGDMDETD
jgi:type I restriction enzyme S subunit